MIVVRPKFDSPGSGNVACLIDRAIQAGRVWSNRYPTYPAQAALGSYKESGIGREMHKVMRVP